MVSEAELRPAAREQRIARLVDAPEAHFDLGRFRCGGALGTVEPLVVGTNPAPDADGLLGLEPKVRLTDRAVGAARS